MASRTYTQTDKILILKQLEENGGNVEKTCKETGVAQSTLHKWRRDVTLCPELAESNRQAAILLRDHIEAEKKKIHDSVAESLKLTLERGNRLLASETDLNKVGNYLKAATELIKIIYGVGGREQYESSDARLDHIKRTFVALSQTIDADE